MKTPWLGLAIVLLSASMQAQSNEGCDVLKIAGARLIALTMEGAVSARLNRSLGPEPSADAGAARRSDEQAQNAKIIA